MTFDELKFLILDKQRKAEINQLFHLYVKAENYGDILRIVKSEGNFKWIFRNGFREFLQYFPIEELENEGFYDREINLKDLSTDVIILANGTLNLTQSGNKRCKVICDAARLNIIMNDTSMVEIESFQRSIVNLTTNSYSYGYITARDQSQVTITGNERSTILLNGYGYSVTNAELQPDSFVNSILNDDAVLNINSGNYFAKQNDKSKINA